MTRYLDVFLADKPAWIIPVIGLAMVTMIGLLDYATGYEISLFIFFALPVVLVTWYSGKKTGCFFCLLSILTWGFADKAAGHVYSQEWIFYWNGSMRLVFFLMVTYWASDVRELLSELGRLAHTDTLTGCLNSLAFREKCDTLFPLSRRMKQPITLGFIDLDNFKGVNDKKGHAEGDRILKTTAAAMMKSVRKTDIVSRLGGDEFVVLLPNTESEQARIVFDHIVNRVSGEICIGLDPPLGLSIGVMTFHAPSVTTDQAIRMADDLMYKAKRNGKNTIVYEVAAAA